MAAAGRTVFSATLVVLLGAIARAQQPPPVLVPTASLGLVEDVLPPIDPRQASFTWRVRRLLDASAAPLVVPSPGTAGDPTPAGATGGGATFTLYNAAGTVAVFTVPLAAAGWHHFTTVDHHDAYAFVDVAGPIFRVFVKPEKLFVHGGKAGWGYPLDAPAQGRLGVRLVLGSDVTWCAEVGPRAPTARYDRPGKFIAPRTPAPAACPSVPTGS